MTGEGDLIMDISTEKWYQAIPERRSRRSFDGRNLKPEDLELLHKACRELRPFPEVRAVLVENSPGEVFKGVAGNYGKVTGAPSFIAFIGNMADRHVNEKLGYLGEEIILEAAALGVGTCWVGGYYRPEVAGPAAGLRDGEQVLAVTPIGYAIDKLSWQEKTMTGFGRSHRRKPLSELVSGLDQNAWPVWALAALEAARLAPSAVNRQPWRFLVEDDAITVSVDGPDNFHIPKRLDCGIAMLHLELGMRAAGFSSSWVFLETPQVARIKQEG
jgi:nitroreductase